MNPEQRKKLNDERLKLVSPSIRSKVESVLSDMEGEGYDPLIAKDVWRSPQRQLELYRQGRSKARWGFHCGTTPDGKPDSLAVDIVDADVAWEAKQSFWLALGRAARAQGMGWGGWWGLSVKQNTALGNAMSRELREPIKLAIGWDAAHVEIKGITIAQAKAGKRPWGNVPPSLPV